MQDIRGLLLSELKTTLVNWDLPGYRAGQIFSWLYKKDIKHFEQMTNLSYALRRQLIQHFALSHIRVVKKKSSLDGTKKFLIKLSDENLIESVLIPAPNRVTGCISSQAGCRFGCRFCSSRLGGFKRNLVTSEIINQIISLQETQPLNNLVIMGVGEPLDNYDNVIKAVRIINTSDGLGISARRITISTCGILPGINRLAREGLQIELSISLHAADERTRSRLMPINKQYPLKDLITACRNYIRQTKRLVTFEYLLIDNLNADPPSARRLVRLLKRLDCKVNLIPFNPITESSFSAPNPKQVLSFRDILAENNIKVTIRTPRGRDIQAACGQLRARQAKHSP